eukprot:5341146-Pyramimonas_sp.AAC.1
MVFCKGSGFGGCNSYADSLKSQEWRSGAIQDRQDAAVRLIRGILGTIFWHASGSSNGCIPTRQFPQWR